MNQFDAGYFQRQYGQRSWRAAGEKPVLDRARLRWLRRTVPSGTLLEIGAGLGSFSRRASAYYRVLGTDLNQQVVASAFGDAPVDGLVLSAFELPFRDGALDILCAFDVLEHLPSPAVCIGEAARALRPGGLFFMSVPNPEGLGARRKGRESFIYRDSTHCSVLPRAEWLALFDQHGFDTVRAGTDTLWDPPYVRWLPSRLQWLTCIAMSQAAWMIAPAFSWTLGENFVYLGRRR